MKRGRDDFFEKTKEPETFDFVFQYFKRSKDYEEGWYLGIVTENNISWSSFRLIIDPYRNFIDFYPNEASFQPEAAGTTPKLNQSKQEFRNESGYWIKLSETGAEHIYVLSEVTSVNVPQFIKELFDEELKDLMKDALKDVGLDESDEGNIGICTQPNDKKISPLINMSAIIYSPHGDPYSNGAEFRISEEGGEGDCLFHVCSAASVLAKKNGLTANDYTMRDLRQALKQYILEHNYSSPTFERNEQGKMVQTGTEMDKLINYVVANEDFDPNFKRIVSKYSELIQGGQNDQRIDNEVKKRVANNVSKCGNHHWGTVDFDLNSICNIMNACAIVIKGQEQYHQREIPYCQDIIWEVPNRNPDYVFIIYASGVHYQLGCLRPAASGNDFDSVWSMCNIPSFLKALYNQRCGSYACTKDSCIPTDPEHQELPGTLLKMEDMHEWLGEETELNESKQEDMKKEEKMEVLTNLFQDFDSGLLESVLMAANGDLDEAMGNLFDMQS